ncbi:MAG TPA: hypothetical protein DEQ79_11180 [Alphaproteobacteria bacterium]|jgi:putative copper resistance protein D|nr:hypothetical protein [Alphaproteobacteria bacterium]
MEFWGLIIPFITLCLYAGMFLANGSILYGILFARYMTDASRTHLARVLAIGAWIGFGATCLRVPAAAGNLGGDLASAVDPQFMGLMMGTSLGLSTVLAALGFIMAATLPRVVEARRPIAGGVTVAVIAASFAIHGHAVLGGLMTGLLLVVHLSCVAVWLGAFLPLRRLCMLADSDAPAHDELADIAHQFARVASWAVGALVISGGGFAAYLTGSLTALFTTAYGLVLLAKIGLVAGLLGLAALNRFRLVPDLRGGDISAAARLQTSINLEIAVVAVILTLTAVLTNALALPMPLPM